MIMKAVVLLEPSRMELQEIPEPVLGSADIICRVKSVSICGTDPHIIQGEFPGLWPQSFPFVPGHEWAGEVVQTGPLAALSGWKDGDRVCGISHVGCGLCDMCLEGRFNLCLNYGKEKMGHRQYGHYSTGAYSEYIMASMKSVAAIPDDLDFDVAACLDPLSISLHVVMRSGIKPGDNVLITGSGAQGLMSIICARELGAGRIVVSGSGYRLKFAEKIGALTLNYKDKNVLKDALDMTEGRGFQRVIECSGSTSGFTMAVDAVAKGGVVSVVSLPDEPVEISLRRIVLDEIDIRGNRANPNTLKKAISIAVRNRELLRSMITHTFPLSEFDTAFEIFTGRKDNSVKVILKP